jgi:type IV pilus assembly protein PilE
MRPDPAGFTLIELMITVTLLAIITMISVASYRQYMLRANRTDAAAVLLRIAAAQERWFLNNNQYSDDPVALGIGDAMSEHRYYTVTINRDVNPAAGYTAVAVPTAGGRQSTDTDCQELSIDETGLRGSATADVDVCWR